MQNSKKAPFFAKFLENQIKNDDKVVGGCTSPIRDTFHTMKFPSDGEDNGGDFTTKKYPSDSEDNGGDMYTMKYPSDGEDNGGDVTL